MILRAHVETIPLEPGTASPGPAWEVEVEAATYEAGRALLDDQLNDGERLITIRVTGG